MHAGSRPAPRAAHGIDARPRDRARPLFRHHDLPPNLVIQGARQEQAARAYESRVLVALQEVEDALVSLA